MPQNICVLGATGSIGCSTLDVIRRNPERFSVFALTARSQDQKLLEQVREFSPQYAVLTDEKAAMRLQQAVKVEGLTTEVLSGSKSQALVAADSAVDAVMAAIVGAAGLLPTLAAVKAGKKVLLANKEALVMAGDVFMDSVRDSGAVLLPIDSEHNAIFQCMPPGYEQGLESVGVRRILLTASGGPFRDTPVEQLEKVTPEQACAHPNWSMGRKISVDSATMMNKGLEVIEACWLFNAAPEQVEVVVHPQSIIHSLVDYVDGSVLAQLGNPDMRTPIAHALSWPERIDSGVSPLDLIALGRMDFRKPSLQKYPCLKLAQDAVSVGGTASAMLNAANEQAVSAFLEGLIGFNRIPQVIDATLQQANISTATSIDSVLAADVHARTLADRQISLWA